MSYKFRKKKKRLIRVRVPATERFLTYDERNATILCNNNEKKNLSKTNC